jgi:hypothetical protein
MGSDERGSTPGSGNDEIFLFATASREALVTTQSPDLCTLGALPRGVKRLGHEADNSLASSAEVKNAWSYTSTAPISFNGVVLN